MMDEYNVPAHKSNKAGIDREYIMRVSSFLCDLAAIYTRVDIDMKSFSLCGVNNNKYSRLPTELSQGDSTSSNIFLYGAFLL